MEHLRSSSEASKASVGMSASEVRNARPADRRGTPQKG